MGLRMCLWPLGLREQGPLARNPDPQLSKGSQGQGSSGPRCSPGWLQVWDGFPEVSEALVGEDVVVFIMLLV